MAERVISLSIGTTEAEEWFQTFAQVSDLAKMLGQNHRYVHVSSTNVDDVELEDVEDDYASSDKTLLKVHAVLQGMGISETVINTMINNLHGNNVVFRERKK